MSFESINFSSILMPDFPVFEMQFPLKQLRYEGGRAEEELIERSHRIILEVSMRSMLEKICALLFLHILPLFPTGERALRNDL